MPPSLVQVIKVTPSRFVAQTVVLERGVLSKLQELGLFNNAITDAGAVRLAKCLKEHTNVLPALRQIYLGGNLKVSAKAKRALRAAAGRVEVVA